MAGMQYGGQLGGQYGGAAFGGQYGPHYTGRRLDLTPPGVSTPRLRLNAIISVQITPEHTAISEMTIELPPFDGLNADTYVGGTMAYHIDGRLIFSADINDLSVADDHTLAISGPAIEDYALTHDEYDISYGRMLTADAIEDFLSRLPYESVVHPAPPRPINNYRAQFATKAGGFSSILQAGQNATETDDLPLRARDLPDDLTVFMPFYYVPSLHPTTPLARSVSGLTSTQTAIFREAEHYLDADAVRVNDSAASGGQAMVLDHVDAFLEYEYGFLHDIPPGFFAVAMRARIGGFGPEPFDRIQFKINGQIIALNNTTRIFSDYDDYKWYLGEAALGDTLPARDLEAGDDPHKFEIEKVLGDDQIYIDCLAFRDRRFAFGTSLNETVDGNGALDGPSLFPSAMPVVFDTAKVGADLNHVTWTVDYNAPANNGVPGIMVPKLNDSVNGGVLIDSEKTIVEIDYDIPDDETVINVNGIAFIDNYTDESRTESPKTNTQRQVVEDVTMLVDGIERSIIAAETEYQGTALSILQDLHGHANRHFVVEHGVEAGQLPRVDSFEKGDDSLIAGESNDWVITDRSREVTDNGDVNAVLVIGAQAPDGTYYQGIAYDLEAIAERGLDTPDAGEDIELVELRDKSLTSDNDCLSRARTELRERSRLSIGGDLDIAPLLLDPGFPYRIQAFDTSDIAGEVGYGIDYGQDYGVGSLGVNSSLESISYSESADGASTSLSFERPSALLQTIESIVETTDKRPTPVRDEVPSVALSSAEIPAPPDGDGGGGGDPGPSPGDPTASFYFFGTGDSIEIGETVFFDARGSSDPQ